MWLFSSSAGTNVLLLSIMWFTHCPSPEVSPEWARLFCSVSTFTLVPFYSFVVDNISMTEATRWNKVGETLYRPSAHTRGIC
jgi:hypothetical protein